MKFREHRGGLNESMETLVEVPDRAALLEHLRTVAARWPMAPEITDETVSVNPYYGLDDRTGWDTHIVVIKDYGPMGFTDGPTK
jgi:hypothetical protein